MVIEQHKGIYVLRDDVLPGGTKSTFLPELLDTSKDYFVYASPVYGGMQIALAHYCRSIGKQAVIFCAKRGTPYTNTLKAKEAGAIVYQVPFGYLSNCQAKAKEFVAKNNAQLINFGADYPVAIDAIARRMRKASEMIGGEPDAVYCAVGSGTLLKGIIKGTTRAAIHGVRVGAQLDMALPDRVTITKYPKPFEYESKYPAPFPSCANYDLKAWEVCCKMADTKARVLFWNVL